jgi:hypothetical protein
VGRGLLHKLIDIAGDKGGQVCDLGGTSHDLTIMERRLRDPGLSADGAGEDYVPVF